MDLGKFFSELRALIGGAEKELAPDSGGTRFTEAEVQAREKKVKEEAEKIAFAETEKLKKEKEESDRKLKEIEIQKRKDDIASFCEGLCKEAKLTPALRKIIEPVMIAVSEISAPIEFAEGVSVGAFEKTPIGGIKGFLTELPKVVTFKEVTSKEGPASGGSAAEKIEALIKKKMEEKKDLSYSAAFAEVQKENLELANEIADQMRGNREKK